MERKIIVKILFILFLFVTFIILYNFQANKKQPSLSQNNNIDEKPYSSNILKDVNYISRDAKGNEYIIDAAEGEIDMANSDVIFLKDVKGLIKLNDKDNINIISDYGKYNNYNNDTIFSKNVIITYLENKITGEYLDFSVARNSMIVSKNVVYYNDKNILKADAIEINLQTKDAKIFMYDKDKKVNITNIK